MKKKLKILCALVLVLAALFGAACTGPAHSGQDQTPGGEDDPSRVKSVKLDHSVMRLVLGETKTLTATVLPDTAEDKSVRWESSDPAVLTVNEGELTALSEGTVDVTVTTNDGGYTAVCMVLVADGVISDEIDLGPYVGDYKDESNPRLSEARERHGRLKAFLQNMGW